MPSVLDWRIVAGTRDWKVSAGTGAPPIPWQPSALTPVFGGYRDYEVDFERPPVVVAMSDGAESEPGHQATQPGQPGATVSPEAGVASVVPAVVQPDLQIPTETVRCRVFYPTLDGSPVGAPILTGTGRFPLVVFAHGSCPGDADHHEVWTILGIVLARSGYVVVMPEIAHTDTPGTNTTMQRRIKEFVDWARDDWEGRSIVMPAPSTALAGHSFGAALCAEIAGRGDIPLGAYASLSGRPISDVWQRAVPKLITWGDGGDALIGASISDWRSKVEAPAHVAIFEEGGHWDYLPADRVQCSVHDDRGPCHLVPFIAAEILALFLARHLPPERWANGSMPSGGWPNGGTGLTIPDSLVPPPLVLTSEQAFYAGGQFAAWSALSGHEDCGVTLEWALPSSSGTEHIG